MTNALRVWNMWHTLTKMYCYFKFKKHNTGKWISTYLWLVELCIIFYINLLSKIAPISGHVINQILYLETPGNNSRHVDECCTAGLGNALNMAPFWCLLLY